VFHRRHRRTGDERRTARSEALLQKETRTDRFGADDGDSGRHRLCTVELLWWRNEPTRTTSSGGGVLLLAASDDRMTGWPETAKAAHVGIRPAVFLRRAGSGGGERAARRRGARGGTSLLRDAPGRRTDVVASGALPGFNEARLCSKAQQGEMETRGQQPGEQQPAEAKGERMQQRTQRLDLLVL
jgi:hypothetical protein